MAETAHLKLPPSSLEAEQAVLGGLLLDPGAVEQVLDKINEDDFYRQDHRLIYRAVLALIEQNRPTDVLTVSEWLRNSDHDKDAGGLDYLTTLANSVASAANVAAYANIVREKSVLRNLIDAGTEITTSAYQPEGREVRELLDSAERRVFEIAEKHDRGSSGFRPLKDTVKEALERLHYLEQHEGTITGLPSGLKEFDKMTTGLQASDLVIIAGRPSMGKTSFAMNIAEYAALDSQRPVAVFSMEMSRVQITLRLISSLGRINQEHLRTGQLDQDEWGRINHAIAQIKQMDVHIDETPALSPNEVRARSRRLKRDRGDLGLIVVDYLQLMQVPGSNENRAQEIAEISRNLKALAKELNVPVIALSQLNRSLEQRPNKRPMMSDLRESGGIEQDADLIVFIYRDDFYNKDSQDKGKAEIIIGKQRNGPTGSTKVAFLGHYTRFEDLAPEYYEGMA